MPNAIKAKTCHDQHVTRGTQIESLISLLMLAKYTMHCVAYIATCMPIKYLLKIYYIYYTTILHVVVVNVKYDQ